MKKRLSLIAIAILFFCATVSKAQSLEEQTRQYLREKLVFYYVDNPGVAKPANWGTAFEINKNDIAANKDITSPVWTSANNLGLKNLLIKILRPSANGGDARLQRIMRNILLVTDKKVYVYLYNDVPNVAPHKTWTDTIYCTNKSAYAAGHNNASWPCANTFTNRNLDATGHIGIGAHFFSPTRTTGSWSGEKDKGHVFLHELVHTQIPLVLESTLTVNMYGSDGGHSLYELIPSRNSAFNEGIATSFAYRYYLPSNLAMTKWYNDNSILYVDNLKSCSATSTQAHCLQTRLTKASVAAEATCWHDTAACYKLRNIPSNLLMYNENVSANILYEYMQHFGSEMMLVRDIKAATTEMAKSTNYTFAPLFKEMVKSGLNFSNSSKPAGTRTHGQFLPIAIVDYFTGYQVKDKVTLGSVFDVTWDANYTDIDDYFKLHRSTLLGFRTNATTWHVDNQLGKITEHLNVRTPKLVAGTPSAPK